MAADRYYFASSFRYIYASSERFPADGIDPPSPSDPRVRIGKCASANGTRRQRWRMSSIRVEPFDRYSLVFFYWIFILRTKQGDKDEIDLDDNSQCNAIQRATAVRYYPLKSIKTIEPVRKLFPSCRYCTAQCWITAWNNASVVIGPVQHNKKACFFFLMGLLLRWMCFHLPLLHATKIALGGLFSTSHLRARWGGDENTLTGGISVLPACDER